VAEDCDAGCIDIGIRLQIIKGPGQTPTPGSESTPSIAGIVAANTGIALRIGDDILAAIGRNGIPPFQNLP
jgi:hypothetical protein